MVGCDWLFLNLVFSIQVTLAWASKALESPGVMASLFNYFNTAKETDCQIVAQGSREESSGSQALSASRVKVPAAGSLRSCPRERTSAVECTSTEEPQRRCLCQPSRALPSLTSAILIPAQVRAGGAAHAQTGRSTAAEESWDINNHTALNILVVEMTAFLCLEGITGFMLLLRF